MWPEDALLAINGVGIALTCLSSIPATRTFAKRCRKRQNDYQSLHGVYCDQDGSATDESVNAYSDKVQRWLIAVMSVVGLFVSLAAAIIWTLDNGNNLKSIVGLWLQFILWVRSHPFQRSLHAFQIKG